MIYKYKTRQLTVSHRMSYNDDKQTTRRIKDGCIRQNKNPVYIYSIHVGSIYIFTFKSYIH